MNRAKHALLGSIPVLAVMWFAPPASADMAPPPPGFLECPPGAAGALPVVPPDALDERGRPLRPWPYCAATVCASDADCTDGRHCSTEEIGLCMEDHEVPGGPPVRAARDRGCEPDGTCLNLQATCERARRCVVGDASAAGEAPAEAVPAVPPAEEPPAPPPPPPPPPAPAADAPASGCACRVAPHSDARGSLLLLASLAGAVALRTRRRR